MRKSFVHVESPLRIKNTRTWAIPVTTAWAALCLTAGVHGQCYSLIHTFLSAAGDGAYPVGAIIQGSDGALYGTTQQGGAYSHGTIFRYSPTGDYQIIHSFAGPDGSEPGGQLLQGNDGALYGSTFIGGAKGLGVVYTVHCDGTGFAVLHHFTGMDGDGALPFAGLIQGTDGVLYSTARNGGTNDAGTVYRLNPDGTGYATLHSFTGLGGEGAGPDGRLIEGRDGFLYGTARAGGTDGNGIVFALRIEGAVLTVVHHFTGPDGSSPNGGFLQGTDGWLYGTTDFGGANNYGTVFKMPGRALPDQPATVLYNFNGGGGHGIGQCDLMQAPDGKLYGTTYRGGSIGGGTIYTLNTNGGSYALLHNFAGSPSDGACSESGVTQGSDGALYGTTIYGGGSLGGVMFRLATSPAISRQPISQTNLIGGTAVFTIVASGIPAPVCQWRKDGVSLTDNGHVSGSTSPTLRLSPLALSDAGNYSVALSNSCGNVTSMAPKLAVVAPAALQADLLADRSVRLSFTAVKGWNTCLKASGNLVDWVTLTNVPNADGPVQFLDLYSPHYPRRFYRILWTR